MGSQNISSIQMKKASEASYTVSDFGELYSSKTWLERDNKTMDMVWEYFMYWGRRFVERILNQTLVAFAVWNNSLGT